MTGDGGSIAIPKVWRSELVLLVLYVASCGAAAILSLKFPQSVVQGPLVSFSSSTLQLALPLFWLIPLTLCFLLLFRIYNVRYSADARGIEAVSGVLSLKQTITRVRYEDIRSIETDQTVIGRLLDIGDVEVGTAATAGIEIILRGVSAPKEVRDMFQAERDKRDRLAQRESSPAAVTAR